MADEKQTSPQGLTQPKSQNPPKKEEDTNPVPVSIRGHKAVPAHPYAQQGSNPAYKGDANAKPKTLEELAAAQKKTTPPAK
jgi:hypothetical protein